jgi:branched-subunit amino acid ABC-type transport system permease component
MIANLALQALNGLVYGMLLFLLSAGLTLIFGLMRVINLTHGSFYMLGAFIGFSVLQVSGNFWLALVVAPLLTAALGVAFELVFIRRVYRRPQLDQVLLTFGFTMIFFDLVQTLWGNAIRQMPPPAALDGMVAVLGSFIPLYRLFLIGLGLALGFLLWLVLDRSRLGAMVRAGVDNRAMAAGLGIDIERLFTIVFATSVGLAALAGVAAGPVLGLYPGMDAEFLILGFIVVVCGGMGSLRGAFLGSLLIGQADIFGRAYLPQFAMFLVYAVMIALLLARPQGLFGTRQHA